MAFETEANLRQMPKPKSTLIALLTEWKLTIVLTRSEKSVPIR
jgi:hypothetical protein